LESSLASHSGRLSRFPLKILGWALGLTLVFGGLALASFQAPQLLDSDPAQRYKTVTFNAPFTLHFSHKMRRDSVERAFSISPSVEGEFEWKDGRTLEFYPTEDLNIGDEYRIVISGKASSLWGKHISGRDSLNFRVGGPPYVLFTHFEDGVITVMFDRAMDFEEAENEDLLSLEPEREGNIRLLGRSAFQFELDEALNGVTLLATIPKGVPTLDGGLTQESHNFEILPPDLKVSWTSPNNGDQEVSLMEPIEVVFNQPVDLGAIKPGGNVLLYPSNDLEPGGKPKMDGFFNAEVVYGKDRSGKKLESTLIFTPTFPYTENTEVLFVLKADEGLGLKEDVELYFSTMGPGAQMETGGEMVQEITHPDELIFFVEGEFPRLPLNEPPKESTTLKVCALSTADYIQTQMRLGWDTFDCSTKARDLDLGDENLDLELNLNDYFKQGWSSGLYVAILENQEERILKRFLIQDASLLIKKSNEGLLVWAMDTKSGEALTEMQIDILSFEGEVIHQGRTNEEGLFILKEAPPLGFYVRGLKEEGSYYGFASEQWIMESEHSSIYLILNQETFKPGETLMLKGIWREERHHLLSLPENAQVTVSIVDERENRLAEKRVALRRNGSFDAELKLPKDAPEGTYFVIVSDLNLQRLSVALALEVKSKSPELNLSWLRAPKDYMEDRTPVFMAQARYPSGIPAKNLTGRYELYKQPYQIQLEDGAFYFSFAGASHACLGNCDGLVKVGEGELSFNQEGVARLLLTENGDQFLKPGFEYLLKLNAGDSNLHASFRVHPGEFDLGLSLKHTLLKRGDPLEVSIAVQDFEGVGIDDQKVMLSLVSEAGMEVFEKKLTTLRGRAALTLEETMEFSPGPYILKAETVDESKNTITRSLPLTFYSDTGQELEEGFFMAADQSKYYVGGRAHLLINVPEASEERPASILLTSERGGLIDYQMLSVTEPISLVSIPIEVSMTPYFRVVATHFQRGLEPRFEQETIDLLVSNDDSQIFIDVEMEPASPKAGDEVSLSFFTYDLQNRPVPSVITLRATDGPMMGRALDPESFYGPLLAMPAATKQTQFSDQVLSATPLISPSASIYFDPLIVSDEGGRASVSFELPGALDQLHIQALATASSDQMTSAKLQVDIANQLLIYPVLPDYLSPGDQSSFTTLVKNVSDETLSTRVKLIGSDIILQGEDSKKITLKPGEQTEVSFKGYVDPLARAELLEIEFQAGADSLKTELTLIHLTKRELVANSGPIGELWSGLIQTPAAAIKPLTELRVFLSGGIEYLAQIIALELEESPVRSTMDLSLRLMMVSILDQEGQGLLLNQLLERIDEEGLYHFWNEEMPDFRLTAFAHLATWEALEDGLELNDELATSFNTLWSELRRGTLPPDDQALILWVMGLYEYYDTELTLNLYQEVEALSPQGKMLLLMNMDQLIHAGQRSISSAMQSLKAQLLDQVVQEGEAIAHFQNKLKESVLFLVSLNALDPEDPLLKPLQNYISLSPIGLGKELDPELGFWLALVSDINLGKNSENSNAIFQLKVNGQLIMDQSITDQTQSEVFEADLDAQFLSDSDQSDIFLQKSGDGVLFMGSRLLTYLDPKRIAAQEKGLVLTRELVEIDAKAGDYLQNIALIVPSELLLAQLTVPVPGGMRVDPDHLVGSSIFDQVIRVPGGLQLEAAHMPAGVYLVEIPMVASLSGEYHLLPAELGSLLTPSLKARTGGELIQISQ